MSTRWFCWTGAAEDGRAPTEERTCVRGWGFCWAGAAEDGRAPTEERSCVRVGASDRWGRPGRPQPKTICLSPVPLLETHLSTNAPSVAYGILLMAHSPLSGTRSVP